MKILIGPAPVSNAKRRWTGVVMFEPRNLWMGVFVAPRTELGDRPVYVTLAPTLTVKLTQLAGGLPAVLPQQRMVAQRAEAENLRQALAR